jgi:hypothetical protein
MEGQRMSDEDTIGDIDPDDTHDPEDGNVDWSNIDRVQRQVEEIDSIEYDDDRLDAAIEWADKLGGES